MSRKKGIEKKEKVKIYERILEEVREGLTDKANRDKFLGEMATLLKDNLKYSSWVGFYYVRGKELHLGPYQGPPACEKIPFSQGICGKAAVEEETMVIPDVKVFPKHMASGPHLRSEIVVPVFDKGGQLVSILDLDSTEKGAFDRTDRRYLEELASIMREKI